jgi:hypothetical protein
MGTRSELGKVRQGGRSLIVDLVVTEVEGAELGKGRQALGQVSNCLLKLIHYRTLNPFVLQILTWVAHKMNSSPKKGEM